MQLPENVEKLRIFNKLKSVYRFAKVRDEKFQRNESSAEHTWNCLVVADVIMSEFNYDVNRLKVYELLMYHDLVEVHAGDFPLHDLKTHDKKKQKQEIELLSAQKLTQELPPSISSKFYTLFEEFEEAQTIEAKLANVVDKFEAIIHEISYKDNWKGWTKEFTLTKVDSSFDEFKEIKVLMLEIIEYLDEEGYFEE